MNVGRGPALGINGQLRIAGPSGATKPGEPAICDAGGSIDLLFGETWPDGGLGGAFFTVAIAPV
jgi:hypothetical protein